jgi:hypothetical protein
MGKKLVSSEHSTEQWKRHYAGVENETKKHLTRERAYNV